MSRSSMRILSGLQTSPRTSKITVTQRKSDRARRVANLKTGSRGAPPGYLTVNSRGGLVRVGRDPSRDRQYPPVR